MYPSEQQYYNAIKRKGYKASATDMPSTLAIHNAVNEKGWEMVKEWERARAEAADASGGGDGDAGGPKLLRFTGRPQDTSPKAWIKSTLLGYRPPFDRCVGCACACVASRSARKRRSAALQSPILKFSSLCVLFLPITTAVVSVLPP